MCFILVFPDGACEGVLKKKKKKKGVKIFL